MAYLLDDFSREDEVSLFGTEWFVFSDQVMGGISQAQASHQQSPDGPLLHFGGKISLENQGGFIQLALPLIHSRYLFDARHFRGVHLLARANQREGWYIHLRTKELSMPWQHYRAPFYPCPDWEIHQIPFELFYPVGTGHPLNLERLTRIGIVAGQRAFQADLELKQIGFYPG
ncbi:hypothetical protein COW36_13990 [bacterium (Candidatus Blackallbacteria) CG17_big_fil_post_rev_8_21_14_2_50_48_46]|uniref:NADH:ubiquinone oxidoreductase intermediate-associated protein 30 domain-containing protein n=1 Tax=bacterium (Candidatus Blackallbacteria) CG17_big_fil_post_rev_8_21_14_2_50_48_46 TaxID=2014261 RepID=A0A2M7G3F5_9BACT|nr:MAG: hypothetical protein COW64_23460 [bacterium (Candidatus Blackallbacteria) CG18_big_fil_WC_8_21_14_2_50_49_26]PIW16237.1 MAG: hypothetical protein COW36_13990 [bacterium (Candidatus Blackallbacteria) CG17_big_fil_post_rev_8_21_14_2_50_48_46]PIW49881.1 MAG: hypothetical protein COW20_04315 [bacterium (Candidatus Blackallbacteria) CG13_big_fil_rev_8_21_14_2_50_49_14]